MLVNYLDAARKQVTLCTADILLVLNNTPGMDPRVVAERVMARLNQVHAEIDAADIQARAVAGFFRRLGAEAGKMLTPEPAPGQKSPPVPVSRDQVQTLADEVSRDSRKGCGSKCAGVNPHANGHAGSVNNLDLSGL